MGRKIVVALGGNAISMKGTDPFEVQVERAKRSMAILAPIVEENWQIAVTHGNGPQVGNALRRVELSQHEVVPMPLSICGATTQGEIGVLLALALGNTLNSIGFNHPVATIVTRVVVDPNDPGFKNPSKFIGRFYTYEEAEKLIREQGWIMREDIGRGWRRVVASPWPMEIIEKQAIKNLMDAGMIIISTGGGGIPVLRKRDGSLVPVDAVIDKDRASAVLALGIGAEKLLIITSIDRVSLNFGKPEQIDVSQMTVSEAKGYYKENHFPPGSMGPKIESSIYFIENGGKEVIITSIEQATKAQKGKGRFTRIIP